MSTLPFDRETVRFLVNLGGRWVSDERYVAIFHVPCQDEVWPQGVVKYYHLSINSASLEGTRIYHEKWEDLVAEIDAARAVDAEVDLRKAIPATGTMLGELWDMHRTLESALDMVEAILAHPTRFRNGFEWACVLERRLGFA